MHLRTLAAVAAITTLASACVYTLLETWPAPLPPGMTNTGQLVVLPDQGTYAIAFTSSSTRRVECRDSTGATLGSMSGPTYVRPVVDVTEDVVGPGYWITQVMYPNSGSSHIKLHQVRTDCTLLHTVVVDDVFEANIMSVTDVVTDNDGTLYLWVTLVPNDHRLVRLDDLQGNVTVATMPTGYGSGVPKLLYDAGWDELVVGASRQYRIDPDTLTEVGARTLDVSAGTFGYRVVWGGYTMGRMAVGGIPQIHGWFDDGTVDPDAITSIDSASGMFVERIPFVGAAGGFVLGFWSNATNYTLKRYERGP